MERKLDGFNHKSKDELKMGQNVCESKSKHVWSHKVVVMDKKFHADYIGNDKVDFNMDDSGTLKEEG